MMARNRNIKLMRDVYGAKPHSYDVNEHQGKTLALLDKALKKLKGFNTNGNFKNYNEERPIVKMFQYQCFL